MKGRFLYSHCGSLGLKVLCNIRNSARDDEKDVEIIKTGVKVFNNGKLVFADAEFAEVSFGSYKPVDLARLGFEFNARENYLVVLDNSKGDAGPGYFRAGTPDCL